MLFWWLGLICSVAACILAAAGRPSRGNGQDWAALVLGIASAVCLAPWTIGLVRFTWHVAAVNAKARVNVLWFWLGCSLIVWGAIAVIISCRVHSEALVPHLGWAVPYAALVTLLYFMFSFLMKDFNRDWEDKLQVVPYSREFHDACCKLGWDALFTALRHVSGAYALRWCVWLCLCSL